MDLCMEPREQRAGTGSQDTELTTKRRELLRIARARTRNDFDAEDIVQSAFVRALERSESLTRHTNPSAWLKLVVLRMCIDLLRSQKRWVYCDVLELVEREIRLRQPTERWRHVSVAQLDAAIASCNGAYREVFDLRYRRELSYEEIAERLQLPLGTIGTRLRRARARIASHLEQTAAELPETDLLGL
jgi:RNA polymerase sigma-70 factor (ECF subfamily)